jgi:hypothetical protein
MGTKELKIVYGEEKKLCTWPTRQEQPRTNKNLFNQPRTDPFHFYSLSPHFTSVSTVSRGHPSLVSLIIILGVGRGRSAGKGWGGGGVGAQLWLYDNGNPGEAQWKKYNEILPRLPTSQLAIARKLLPANRLDFPFFL